MRLIHSFIHSFKRRLYGSNTEILVKSSEFCVLMYSDYKGWSCLHHAAAEGYTQTMTILLAANIKLLDNTDEDGVKVLKCFPILNQPMRIKYIFYS